MTKVGDAAPVVASDAHARVSLWRPVLLYLALTYVATWPLGQHPASAAFNMRADSDLFMWTLAWDAHAFVHRPWAIFDANIYYPERNTLAFSENLIASAVFAAPIIWLTHNVVLALNAVIIINCALCGVGAYLLNFVRVPARFTIVTVLGMAVLAGFGFERLAASSRTRRRSLMVAAMLVLAIEYSTVPMRPEPYNVEPPAIDRWLNTLPKPFAIAEVPLAPLRGRADIAASEKRQAVYMLHSTAHWQKTVHAFSGFRTPLHEELYAQLRAFPDDASVEALAKLKVDYVVVHTDYYRRDAWERVEPRLAAFSDRLQLVHSEGAGRVYRIRR